MRWLLACLGLVALAPTGACSRGTVESGPAARDDRVTARGVVRRLGSEMDVRTVIEGERRLVVVGDYASEIGRVAGAEVWVTGPEAESPYGPAVEVSEYRILSVDGQIPVVGELGEDERGFYLLRDDASSVRVDVSQRLAEHRGAKIWAILGPDEVTVARYGILRD